MRFGKIVAGLLALAAIVLAPATPASAHTGFESSSPSDGASVDLPVSEISLTFTGEAAPAGEGFVVLDPDGAVRVPDEVSSTDNLTWILRFDDALAGGVVGVRWSVAAPDTHPIDGSFSFTITAPAPAPVVPTTVPSTVTSAPTTVQLESPPSSVATTPEDSVDEQAGSGQTAVAGDYTAETVALDDFLETTADSAPGVSLVAGLSRILRLLGAVGAIGGLVFAAFVLRGDPRDIQTVLILVRGAGALIVIGAVMQAAAQVATAAQSWSGLWSGSWATDTLWSSAGLAIVLGLVAGSLIWFGPQIRTHDASGKKDPVVAVKQLTAAGAGLTASSTGTNSLESEQFVHDGDRAWEASSSPAAVVGVGLLAVSFMFDGHTVSEGPR